MFVGYSCEVASDKILSSLPGNQLAGWKLRGMLRGSTQSTSLTVAPSTHSRVKKSLNLNLHLFVVGTN